MMKSSSSIPRVGCSLDTVQDFWIKLAIKLRMHLWEISILSQNNDIIRPTKIVNRADKNQPHFQKTKYFKNQSFQKNSLIKVGLLIKYSSQNFFSERFNQLQTLKNDFESMNFAIFDEVVHNFGKSEDVIIQ